MAVSKKTKIIWIIVAVAAVVVAIGTTVITLGVFASTRRSEGVVPTDEDLLSAVTYKRVLLIGVDGAGNYFGDVDSPNFDRIFAGGSVNFDGLSQYPTTSAHNWTSMLHGVRYHKHLVDNFVAEHFKYSRTKYPSVFKVVADARPDAQMISVTPWYPLNYGCIEDLNNLIKLSGPKKHKDDKFLTEADLQLKDEFIQKIRDGLEPTIAFMYFAQVDEYGHEYGRDDHFYEAISRVDGYIGEVYDAYAEMGLLEDTLIVLVTDHGHREKGGHGYNSVDERTVTVAVAGAKGNIIAGAPGRTVTHDVASIILYGLGIKQPDSWESKVPYGIFNTLPTE